MGRALDLQSTGRGFKFYSGQSCETTLGKLFNTYVPLFGGLFWFVWHSVRMSVCDQQTFPVLRSTGSRWLTIYVGKPSATGSAN